MKTLQNLSSASLIALIFLCLAWELWLAPIRPGGSWLAFKALPLLFPPDGNPEGPPLHHQWAPMLVLALFHRRVVRAWSDKGCQHGWPVPKCCFGGVFSSPRSLYAKLSAPSGRRNKKRPKGVFYWHVSNPLRVRAFALAVHLLSACR